MRSSILLSCTVLLLLLALLEARDAGKIKQCQCDELMNCRKEARKRESPCIDTCKRKLNHDNWDREEGLKCFDHSESTEHHQCMHAIALQTCTNESNVMINKNETLHFGPRRQHHRRPRAIDNTENEIEEDKHDDVETEESHQHRPREHNRRAFHAFMRKHFGKSGKISNNSVLY